MAAKRIPDLPTLTGAGSVATDLLLIYDADLDTTKSITRSELAEAILADLPEFPEFGTMADQDASAVAITGGTISGVTITGLAADLAVADGGTGASTAAAARTNLGAAASGANSDITSLTGLTTPLSIAQGGTGQDTAAEARVALGAAASGANSDITSLSGLTTPLSVAQGGTGQTTLAGLAAAMDVLSVAAESLATNGYVKFTNGLMLQWGKSLATAWIRTVTFPVAFSAPPFTVVCSTERTQTGASNGSGFVSAVTATQCTMIFDEYNSSSPNHNGYWLALGTWA